MDETRSFYIQAEREGGGVWGGERERERDRQADGQADIQTHRESIFNKTVL